MIRPISLNGPSGESAAYTGDPDAISRNFPLCFTIVGAYPRSRTLRGWCCQLAPPSLLTHAMSTEGYMYHAPAWHNTDTSASSRNCSCLFTSHSESSLGTGAPTVTSRAFRPSG